MKATSFKFDENTTRLLDELKESSHATSRTEVIRKALYLLDIAAKAQKKNERIIIQSADRQVEKEILMY